MRHFWKRRITKAVSAAGISAMLALAAAVPAFAVESAMDVICAPSDIVRMEDGSFLVTDTYNKVIWKVTGRSSTIYVGAKGVEDPYGEPMGGYNDSTAQNSYFKEPWAISPFLNGYAVSDPANNVVRFITEQAAQTATGTKRAGFVNGWGVSAVFNRPTGLATDEAGSLYIADTNNNAIRKITNTGQVTTWATGLNEPTGLCWKNGALYVAESGNHRIVKIEEGHQEVVAGTGAEGNTDGPAGQAQFSGPQGVLVADDGTIYVSDTGNNSVRKIQNGRVTTMITCDQNALEQYPIAPMGMTISGDMLYVCDNFSRMVIQIPR